MNNLLLALFLAAGIAAFTYAKLGRRAGYGNTQNVLVLVAGSFVLSFLVVFILLKTLVDLG